ncbi:NEDD8-conjugating enzyme UBE2F [Pelomyxa schiedti]|nr:NEDD8-conjugating enzyme UBE2F [Pelomyxa schiedti]
MAALMRRTNASALRTSSRSLFLLKEFGKIGEQLELDPSVCRLEFPDAPASGELTSGKYKRFFVKYRPQAGIYAGGEYLIEFDVRKVPEYPDRPPIVKVRTKIWHPNIDLEGSVCHNYLKVDSAFGQGCGWSPVIQMQGLVNGILTMFDFTDPEHHSDSFNEDDPLNLEAAKEYKTDSAAFIRHAKEWVNLHARRT